MNFSQLLAMLCIVKGSYCTREFYTSDGREMQIAAATFTTQKRFALIRKYCYRGNVSLEEYVFVMAMQENIIILQLNHILQL